MREIVVHISQNENVFLARKISAFHADIIERRLAASDLSPEEKLLVIEKILHDLKLREQNGVTL